MKEKFDVVVIGSGGGIKIATAAAALGLKVALLERGPLGGTCLNRGCIPSKILIYPAEFLRQSREAAELDLEIEAGGVRFSRLVERIQTTVGDLREKLRAYLLEYPNLELISSRARFVSTREVEVAGRRLEGERIFIAVGAIPRIPPIAGLRDAPYWTSVQALRTPVLPRRLLVIGGGFIACELGDAYSAFGSEVAYVAPQGILDRLDEDVRQEFFRIFERHNRVYAGAEILGISHNAGVFSSRVRDREGYEFVLETDAVLVAAGVVPDLEGLGLEAAGIGLTPRGFIRVDDRLATGVEGVYAFGDCIGNYLFRHSVNYEAEYLIRSVFGGENRSLKYYPVPWAIFSWPELAGIGDTEKELQAAGVDYVRSFADYPSSNAGTARMIDHGFVKILIERSTRRLLGAQIVGPEASDMIHLFIGLIYMNAGLDDLNRMIYIHPALPELVRDAARSASSLLSQDRLKAED